MLPAVVLVVPLAFSAPALAAPTQAPPVETSPVLRAGAVTCTAGGYVLGLHDLEPAKHSFGADLWLWAQCDSDVVRPLAATEFINGRDVKITQAATVPRAGKFWSYEKVSGTFEYDWQMANFPYDRQELVLEAEYVADIVANFQFVPDLGGTRVDPDVRAEGWKVGQMEMTAPIHTYPTTFGDPLLQQTRESEYSRLEFRIPLQRDSTFTFMKLTAGVYSAVAMVILSFFLDSRQTSLMSARMSMIVGSLFAVLVNLRATEGVLGRAEGLTLVDRIHLLALLVVFLSGVCGILSRWLVERDARVVPSWFDRRAAVVLAFVFLASNAWLVLNAQANG